MSDITGDDAREWGDRGGRPLVSENLQSRRWVQWLTAIAVFAALLAMVALA